MTKPRTIRLDDTVLVVDRIRAFRLEPSYMAKAPSDDGWITTVWLESVSQSFFIRGDHVDALTAAIEGLS
jgi:hypothetical protein